MAATVKKFESEVTSLRDRLEATTASLSEQKSEAVRVTSERDYAQKALVSAETRLERAEAKIEKLQSTLDSTQADLSTARSDLATARAERGQAEAKLMDVQAELTNLVESDRSTQHGA